MKTLIFALVAVLDVVALFAVLRRPVPDVAVVAPRAPAPARQALAAAEPASQTRRAKPVATIPPGAFVVRFQKARQDPAFQQALDAVRRRTTLKAYTPLFDRLQLAPDVRERMLALLLEKQIEKSDAEASAPRNPLDAIAAAQAATNSRLRDLLGQAGYQAYFDYETNSGLRATMDRFAGLAAAQGEPLAPSAREQAVTLLAASTAEAERGAIAGFTGLSAEVASGLVTPPFSSPLPPDAPARLATLLTPGQCAALADLMLRQEDELALRSAVLAAPR